MRYRRLLTVLLGCLGLLLAALPWEAVRADEWSRFRGPNGGGRSRWRLPADWPTREFAWQVQLPGVGHASPVAWGERIFVTSGDEESGDRVLECRLAADGTLLWSRRYAATTHRKHKLNSFASATPAAHAEGVVWAWATPEAFMVVALNQEGRELWKRDLGPFKSGHGGGVSPIVYGDLVVLPSEHNGDSALYALDRETGETRWKVERESKSHYATPAVFAPAGRPASLVFTNWEQGITAVDPATGKVRWQADVFDKGHWESSIGSPVIAGDLVIGVCGYLGYGNEVIAVRGAAWNGEGDEPPRAAWRIERGAPLCTTPLVKDDLVVLWSDAGIVTCADVHTGDVHWRQRVGGTCYASPICLDDTLVNVTADGQWVVLAAGRDYVLKGRRDLGESSHSTAAVVGGLLLLRTMTRLHALPLEPPASP